MRLVLAFQRHQITASLDGVTITTLADTIFASGYAAVASGSHLAEYLAR